MKEKPKIQQSKQLILSHKKGLLEFVQLVELIRVQIMFLVDQKYDWTGGIRVSTEEKGFRNHRFAAKIQFKLYNKKNKL